MKTNSREVRAKIRQHVLDCVYDYDENLFNDFESARLHLLSEFERVAGDEYNKRRIPNVQDRFSDYLCGLPFHFEYTNEGIIDFLNGLGINPDNKSYPFHKSLSLYHNLIFREVAK